MLRTCSDRFRPEWRDSRVTTARERELKDMKRAAEVKPLTRMISLKRAYTRSHAHPAPLDLSSPANGAWNTFVNDSERQRVLATTRT